MAKQQELIVAEKQELAPAAQPETNLLAVIARAAADPQVDVQKMQALLDMQMKIQQKQAEVAFNEALSRLQPRLPRIPKSGQIIVKGSLRSKYMRFEDVDSALRPLLAEEGFSTSFGYEEREKGVRVTLDVLHVAGHKEHRYFDLPIDQSDFRSQVQNVRSSVSFGKRVLLVDFFNIVNEGEDNDGANVQTISDKDLMAIEDMLSQLPDTAKPQFLKYMGVSRLSEIRVGDLQKAMTALKQRLTAKAAAK